MDTPCVMAACTNRTRKLSEQAEFLVIADVEEILFSLCTHIFVMLSIASRTLNRIMLKSYACTLLAYRSCCIMDMPFCVPVAWARQRLPVYILCLYVLCLAHLTTVHRTTSYSHQKGH